jgi:delta 1-pyrroline-5-carboxylate dehydrogenase
VLAATSSPDTWLDSALTEVRTADYDLPNLIGGAEVRTPRQMPVVTPHAHAVTFGQAHRAGPPETEMAIEAALAASGSWGRRPSEERTAPFLRAADLLERSPWRERLIAATMLELSKTAVQAEGAHRHQVSSLVERVRPDAAGDHPAQVCSVEQHLCADGVGDPGSAPPGVGSGSGCPRW